MSSIFLREDKERWEELNLSDRACKSSDKKYKANRMHKEGDDTYRTAFQRDISRILYSNPFRRLRTKNQVIYNNLDQHNRTRLTHSYEVAHLSRQVARALKLNEDLVEAIALGHDLGHTPFGHAGERALNKILRDKGGFSHNAQSVWLVERVNQYRTIEGKPITGLNLTYATREGILKHTKVKTNIDEYKRFHPETKGTLEAQIVNKCDSLAYLYHDMDDGIRNKIFAKEEIMEVWKQEIDVEFDDWYFVLIDDLINNSIDKDDINYSPDMIAPYESLKKFLNSRILNDKRVVEADKLGEEMVTEMFDILMKNNNLIPKNKDNDWKIKTFGIERAIVDFIQWLGDNNFEYVLKGFKNKNS